MTARMISRASSTSARLFGTASARPLLLRPRAARLLSDGSSSSSSNQAAQPAPSADFLRGIEQLEANKLAEAVDIFAQCASTGDPDGNFYLGLAYDGLLGRDAADELPVEIDQAAAVRCYTRAAEAGHAQAMLNLAMCYRHGEGVDTVDVNLAFDWLTKAAATGDDRANFNCGVALDPLHPPYGSAGNTMIQKDAMRAVSYYRKAADDGHGKAMVNLG